MKDCPRCGNPVADTAMFCGSCGATISNAPPKANPANARAVNQHLCPNCGMPKSQSGKFCLGCGTPLDPNALAGVRTTPYSPQKGGFLRFLCFVISVIMIIMSMGNALTDRVDVNFAKNVTITVWAPAEDQAEDNNWLAQMQAQFAAAHPEYTINWVNEKYGSSDAAIAALEDPNEAADVYIYYSARMDELVEANALTNLGTFYTSQICSTNEDLAERSVTYSDGEMYGFPISGQPIILYYDKDVFSENDVLSLDDMLATGRVSLPLGNSWSGSCFFLGTGCTIFGEDGTDESAGFDFANDHGYDAARKMVSLINNSNVSVDDFSISGLINGETDAVFNGYWVYDELKEALGDRLGVAMLPTFSYNSVEYQMTIMSGFECVGVNPAVVGDTQKQTLCMDFAAFLASGESQAARYKANRSVPASSSALTSSELADDELVMAQMNTMDYCSIRLPYDTDMSSYWSAMNDFLSSLVNGDITVRNYKQCVDNLNTELNS